MKSTTALLILAAAGYTKAQQPAWAQCGGQGWTGGTTCVAGYACTSANSYYSQCIPGSTTPTGSNTPSTTTTAPTTTNGVCPGKLTKFKFFGANQSGAEWGDKVPGTENYDFVFPAPSSVDYLMGKGMNTFRIPFMVERLALPSSGGLTGSFNPTYLASLQSIVNYVTNTKGGYAIVDPHNYMRYNGNIITSTADFATFWKNLATVFKSNSRVIFDIMNEPYGIDASVVFSLNQVAVNAIRAAGASQLIIVEGTMWTGAGSWVSSGNGAAFKALKDPGSNIAIEMHQYLNDDGSGSSPICVSTTIAAERLAGATQWLKDNNFKGFLGEIGGGSNDVCIAAIKGGLCAMQQSGVWIGVTWWSAGPWWGNATMSIEPPNGAAISRVLPEALMPFM